MIVRLSIIVFFVILFLILFRRWTDYMVFFPQKVREYSVTPNERGMEYDDLWLQSGKEKIHGWLIKSIISERSGRYDIPTILFFHGNAGHLAHRLTLIEKLRETGAHILIVSYRGFGLSSGKTTEKTAYLDGEAVMDFVLKNEELKDSPIIIFGRSMGGGIAVELAKRYKDRISGLVLEATFTSISDLVWRYYKIPKSSLIMRTNFNNLKKIQYISTPTLFIHGTKDEIIPFEMSEKLYDHSLAKEKSILKIEGGKHEDQFMVAGEEYISSWIEFIKGK
ncbi:MAG: alpha/beta hydrolase [Candidatus Kariarchaeaceae archaeon]